MEGKGLTPISLPADTWCCRHAILGRGEEEGKISPLDLSGYNSLLNAPVTLRTPDSAMPRSSSARLLQPAQAHCCVRIPAQFKESQTFQHCPAAPSFILLSTKLLYRPVSAAPCSPPRLLCTTPPAWQQPALGAQCPHSVPCLGTGTDHRHCSLP